MFCRFIIYLLYWNNNAAARVQYRDERAGASTGVDSLYNETLKGSRPRQRRHLARKMLRAFDVEMMHFGALLTETYP